MKGMTSIAAIAFLAAALVAGGCEQRGDDPDERVSRALESANLDDDVNVDYDRNAGVVHLNGSVASQAERERAEEVAEKAVGTSGSILNELTVEGVNERSADDADGRIRDQLNDRIDADRELVDQSIDFDVANGTVKIEGSVSSEGQKKRAGEIARSVPGVKDVANALEVKPQSRP
jgi:osmotically-inducible protein OsmY